MRGPSEIAELLVTYKMAAKINWHRYGTKLRHCHLCISTFFQIKYAETILSNRTRKLSWFEITKMLMAVKKLIYCIIYYNFRHTFVPYAQLTNDGAAALVNTANDRYRLIGLQFTV